MSCHAPRAKSLLPRGHHFHPGWRGLDGKAPNHFAPGYHIGGVKMKSFGKPFTLQELASMDSLAVDSLVLALWINAAPSGSIRQLLVHCQKIPIECDGETLPRFSVVESRSQTALSAH